MDRDLILKNDMLIGFDQKWMIWKDFRQKLSGGIYHDPDSTAIQTLHDPLVHIIRKRIRNTSGKYQNISLL